MRGPRRPFGRPARGVGVLLALAAAIAFLTGSVAASAAARATTAGEPAGAVWGVVTIEPDGSLSDPAAPIGVAGDLYSLLGPLNGSLVDLRGGITIDGDGFVVNYTNAGGAGDGAALTVNGASGVTVELLHVANASVGARANDTVDLTIEQSVLGGSSAAVVVTNSSSTTVENDRLADGHGVLFENASGPVVEDDQLEGATSGVTAVGSADVTVTGNDLANATGAGGAAIRLVAVDGATIEENFAPNSSQGIEANSSEALTIDGNNVSYAGGLAVGVGLNNVTGATIVDNQAYGDRLALSLANASDVRASGNDLNGSTYGAAVVVDSVAVSVLNNGAEGGAATYGVEVESSQQVNVSGNNASGSAIGIAVLDATNVAIDDNNASSPGGAGLAVGGSNDVTLAGDVAYGTQVGAEFQLSTGVTVQGFETNSTEYGVSVDACDQVEVTGSVLDGAAYGAWLQSSSAVTISQDRGYDDGAGLYLDDPLDLYSALVPTTLTGNVFPSESAVGAYVYEGSAPAVLSDNDFAHEGYAGITDADTDGPVTLLDNNVSGSKLGLFLDGPSGETTIVGNLGVGTSQYGLFANALEGPWNVSENNFSDSYYGSLFLDAPGGPLDTLFGNNFSASGGFTINGTEVGGPFVGNDLLDVGSIQLTDDAFSLVDHNDFDSPTLDASGTTVTGGTWNAAYPIGGNYWSSYSGTDRYSGPSQDVPGSDGIGDTPYTAPGITDDYPLMHPWIAATVTFTERGLPADTPWSVTVGTETVSSLAGAPIVVPQTDGANTTFAWSASSTPRYAPTPRSGSGVLDGRFQTIPIAFTPVTYELTFTASGLDGQRWGVSVNGTMSPLTDASSLVVPLLNGSYGYVVDAPSGFTVAPRSGTVVVNGPPTPVALTFSVYLYSVTFVQSGLPASSSWSVTAAGTSFGGVGPTLRFETGNTSLDTFRVTVPAGYTVDPSTGEFAVDGTNVTVYLIVTRTPTPILTPGEAYAVAAALGVVAGGAIGWALAVRRGRSAGPADGDERSAPPPAPPPPSS